MTGNSTPIQQRYTVRQTAEPPQAGPPWEWINPAGGQSGNNTETYIYNDDVGAWELTNSVGPDTPLREASGAQWRDTGNGSQKVYDGGWQQIGVSDHANLTNVTSGQHHSKTTSSDIDHTKISNQSSSDHHTKTPEIGNLQDVTGSRSGGTLYQNTTGRPLVVNVVCEKNSGSYAYVDLQVANNTNIGTDNNGDDARTNTNYPGVSQIVPPNHYYIAFLSGNLYYWGEQKL